MNFGVCMVAICFYPDVGGIQMHTLALSQALRKMGINVFVITRRLQDVPLYEELDGLPVYRLDIPREMPKYEAAAKFLSGSLNIMRKQRQHFDIIHSHQVVTPTTIGLIGRELYRKKLLINPHTPITSGAFESMVHRRPITGKPRFLWMKSRADGFVAISEEIQQDLINLGMPSNKITYISNGVDTNRFSPLSGEDKLSLKKKLGITDGPVILYGGRLIKRKQVDILIQSFAQAISKLPDNSQLVVVGDGEEREHLLELASSLELGKRVNFIGSVLNMEEYLKATDVFVLPSSSEGLPIVLLEAMACGLPCICSDIGGITDLIDNNVHGLLVPSGDIAALRDAILKFVSSPDLSTKLGRNARQSIQDNYSIEYTAKQYSELYSRLLQ